MTLSFHVPGSVDSWLSRLDPRWKIAAIGCAVVGAAFASDGRVALAAAGLAIGLALFGGVAARRLLAALVPLVGMLVLFFGWSLFWPGEDDAVWSVGGLEISPDAGLRLLTLTTRTVGVVALVFALMETTSLPELGQGLTGLGTPRVFVHILLLTHRYIFVLAEEFSRLRRALRVRGFRSRADRRSFAIIGNVAGMLFVRGHERAEHVHRAMAARGFDGVFRSLSTARTTWAEIAFFAALVAVTTFLVALDRGWLPS